MANLFCLVGWKCLLCRNCGLSLNQLEDKLNKMRKKNRKIEPIHPGVILKQEFMDPFHLSANKLALKLHVPAGRISSIVNGTRAVSPDTALRLSYFFGNSAEFWVNLQSQYDLQIAEDLQLNEIERTVVPMSKDMRNQ